MNIPTLYTERLILRPLTTEDAPAVFVWASDGRVTKYMIYSTYTAVEDVEKWLKTVETDTSTYNFGFVRKEDGLLIGSGGIGMNKETGSYDFGYNFRYDCWNKGYATEAAREMIRFAYESLGARTFSATHAVGNPASGRVMERCGLHFDHYGEFTKFDSSAKFKSKIYTMTLE